MVSAMRRYAQIPSNMRKLFICTNKKQLLKLFFILHLNNNIINIKKEKHDFFFVKIYLIYTHKRDKIGMRLHNSRNIYEKK
jgi:hypothetical protein